MGGAEQQRPVAGRVQVVELRSEVKELSIARLASTTQHGDLKTTALQQQSRGSMQQQKARKFYKPVSVCAIGIAPARHDLN